MEEAVKSVSVGNEFSIGGDGAGAISKSGEASLGLETSAIVDLQISGGRATSLSPDVGPEGVAVGGNLAPIEAEEKGNEVEVVLEKEGTSKKTSYSEAVREVLAESINPEFVVTDVVADVSIPEELMEDVEPLWKCFVVGYFMNDAPHIGSIHSTVNRVWSSPWKVLKIDVQFIGKRTVLFRVEDAQVRSPIIRRKFWHISEVPLVLNERTPESAKAPPDLSAMPLWVDLENVPGYLYSKKDLSFLSRTAGKFVKLHPTTERCVRLDVARVLVEVDLAKPLPRKIYFK